MALAIEQTSLLLQQQQSKAEESQECERRRIYKEEARGCICL